MLKCTGINVTEAVVPGSATKVGVYTAVLTPADGGPAVRVSGCIGTAAASMAYGKFYEIVEAAAPAPAQAE